METKKSDPFAEQISKQLDAIIALLDKENAMYRSRMQQIEGFVSNIPGKPVNERSKNSLRIVS